MSDLGWDLFSLPADHLPVVVAASGTPAGQEEVDTPPWPQEAVAEASTRNEAPADDIDGVAAGIAGKGDQGHDGQPDEPARVIALIQCHCFESALREVRALPPSLPQLPWLMGQLVLALAQEGKHDDTAELASEMLARFPLRPEVTRTLVALAAILAVQGRVCQVFLPLGEAVVHTYAFSNAALLEWAQRLAYRFRRHGNPEAAEGLLGALESVVQAHA